jgi:hypothetical protein
MSPWWWIVPGVRCWSFVASFLAYSRCLRDDGSFLAFVADPSWRLSWRTVSFLASFLLLLIVPGVVPGVADRYWCAAPSPIVPGVASRNFLSALDFGSRRVHCCPEISSPLRTLQPVCLVWRWIRGRRGPHQAGVHCTSRYVIHRW